jgi:LAS superfamily LD-carboxypeptidase LdcB
VANGKVPNDVTVFADDFAAVRKLEPALLLALREAATDAAHDGVTFYVESGWRSATYQRQLFARAVAKYGSTAAAARWVAKPGTSAHELGKAVDLGHADATAWLSRNGASYGLCQIYRDEPWHYELRPHALGHHCPLQYADPTQDPRMRR